jgi:hypothetical protein
MQRASASAFVLFLLFVFQVFFMQKYSQQNLIFWWKFYGEKFVADAGVILTFDGNL